MWKEAKHFQKSIFLLILGTIIFSFLIFVVKNIFMSQLETEIAESYIEKSHHFSEDTMNKNNNSQEDQTDAQEKREKNIPTELRSASHVSFFYIPA